MSGEKRKRPVRSRFPKTSLKAANLVQVGTHVGILRDAIDDDVEYLLYHFRSVKYISSFSPLNTWHLYSSVIYSNLPTLSMFSIIYGMSYTLVLFILLALREITVKAIWTRFTRAY